MKFVDEFRDAAVVRTLIEQIRRTITRPWTIMEVCGGQTHTIVRYGLDELLPREVTLVHGPGCPVCVTPIEMIDLAIELSKRPGVTLCSFGDMLRVPGSACDLFDARAAGADVRVIYSPLDALDLARREPSREVVFFAVGFETTAPTTAMAVHQAARLKVPNFSVIARTCAFRRRSRRYFPPTTIACRDFWRRATYARSWESTSTGRSWRNSKCR